MDTDRAASRPGCPVGETRTACPEQMHALEMVPAGVSFAGSVRIFGD